MNLLYYVYYVNIHRCVHQILFVVILGLVVNVHRNDSGSVISSEHEGTAATQTCKTFGLLAQACANITNCVRLADKVNRVLCACVEFTQWTK